MNRRLLALLALCAALAAAAWLILRPGSGPTEATQAQADPSGRAEIVARKLSARGAAGRDVAPVGIGGRVSRAADGEPVAGAVVLLSRRSLEQGAAQEPGQAFVPQSAVTDAAGQWRLAGVAPGDYALAATAPGYLPAERTDLAIAAGSDRLDLDLVLREGGHPLGGRISDIGGGPVESVLVSVTRSDSSDMLSFRKATFATTTDADGAYRMHLPNGDYVITTWHPDYVGTFRMTTVRDGPRTENIKITPAGAIEGIVRVRDTGEPVAGARVVFDDGRNGRSGQEFRTNMSASGMPLVADDQGRFRLTGLHPGLVELTAFADGWASSEPVDVPLGIGEEVSGVELHVERAFKIAGFVVPKGDPEGAVEGVLVGAFSVQPASLIVAAAPTAKDGYFEILGVRPGNYMVGALGEEVLPNILGNSAVVTDHDVTDMLIEMDTGVHVTGRVSPPGPATVRLDVDMEGFSLGTIVQTVTNAMATATADADGNFDLGPVVPGTFTLQASDADGNRGELDVTVGASGLSGVTIVMAPRASVSGRVLDEVGAPQAGVRVEIRPDQPGAGPQMNLDFGNPFGSGTPTGEDGSFTVRGLDPGPHTVVVKSDKGRVLAWARPVDAAHPTAPLEIEVLGTEQRAGLDLTVEARNGEIAGVVLDAEGLPVADAWVTASEEMTAEEFGRSFEAEESGEEEGVRVAVKVEVDGDEDESADEDFEVPAFFAEPPVLTDPNGRFVVKELRRDRKYRLVAEGEKGGARGQVRDLAAGADVTIELEALAGIHGKVTRSGRPVSTQFSVELDGPTKRGKSVTSPTGEFDIDRIDPGEYEIRVTSDAGVATATAEVESGATTRVTIELDDWGTLRGELVAASTAEPLAGTFVMVVPEKGEPDAQQAMAMFTGGGTRTDRKGRFQAGKVGPGKGRVLFMDSDAAMGDGGGAVATEEYEIRAGEDLDLGVIKGVPTSDIPKDERGDLGFAATVATRAGRPRPPGSDPKEAQESAEEEAEQTEKDADGVEPERLLWVSSVRTGGPAAEAGLEPADRIVRIDGRAVADLGASNARGLLGRAHVRIGQTVELEVEREGASRSISVTAQAPPAKP
jgi:protocatechuate 3,4-dioxygenase beta subunit